MLIQLYKNKRAILYKSNIAKSKKVILFVPGFPKYPNKSEFISFFINQGYHVLVPMYSGTFDSMGDFSISQAVEDVYCWYKFLEKGLIQNGPKEVNKIDFSTIILASSSFGSLIVGLLLKKQFLTKVKKCIFISPLWDMAYYKNNLLHVEIADNTSSFMKFAYPFSYRFQNKKKFFEEIKGSKPIIGMDNDFMDKNKNLLILCGRSDRITPPRMARSFAKEYKNTKLNIIKGGHSSRINQESFINITSKFLCNQ